MTDTALEYQPHQPIDVMLDESQVPKAAHPAMAEWRRLDDLIAEDLEPAVAQLVNSKGQAAAADERLAREAIKAGKPFVGSVAEHDRVKAEADARQHLATARRMLAEQGRIVLSELKANREDIARLAEARITKAADAYAAALDTIEAQTQALAVELSNATTALGALADLDRGSDLGAQPMPVPEPSIGDARVALLAIRARVDNINEKGSPLRLTIKWKDTGNVQELWADTARSFIGSGVADLIDDAPPAA